MEEMTKTVVSGDVGSVEVLFAWRDAAGQRAVIDAELVDAERCPAVWIGAHQGLRFMLPAELASAFGEDQRFRLVGVENGRFVLRVPESAEVVATKKGESLELAPGLDRVRTLQLAADHVAEVRLGDFSFYVRPGAAPEKAADRGPLLDWRAARWGLAAFAAHAVFVGSFFFAPPNASALNMDLDPSAQRYVQVSLAAIAEEREQIQLQQQPGGETGGGATTPDEAAGSGNETPAIHISGGRGTRTGSARRSETTITAENVAAMGTISSLTRALDDMTGDSSVYGNPDMVDGAGGPGFEYLVGGPGVAGWGGPGMTQGRGTCIGANCGQGTVAVGQLHTTGPIGPGGVGDGVDLPAHRVARVPQIHPDPHVETRGGLSREDIRRTVRRHINEVRFCYEQELNSHPDLEGRVAVQFFVNADGTVSTSAVAQSTGPVAEVGQCVSQSVRRWTFPSSEGPTSVTYPFVLQSAQ